MKIEATKMETKMDKETMNMSELIKAALVSGVPAPDPELERRVMLRVARQAIERSRRRARLSLVASLSGLAMLCAACIALLVAWGPTIMPSISGAPFEALAGWLAELRIAMSSSWHNGAEQISGIMSFLGNWGGMSILALILGGITGFFYYFGSRLNENL